jgi:hypothetical protein
MLCSKLNLVKGNQNINAGKFNIISLAVVRFSIQIYGRSLSFLKW